jgi:hypothetical protein
MDLLHTRLCFQVFKAAAVLLQHNLISSRAKDPSALKPSAQVPSQVPSRGVPAQSGQLQYEAEAFKENITAR